MVSVSFSSFNDQKPGIKLYFGTLGTSGLRKKCKVFEQPHYRESFIQSILNTLPTSSTLVVGGDGRYLVKETVQLILNMACVNGVKKVVVGQNGIMSTPAASLIIRKIGAQGGILLTASHNPGGPSNDFGIKFNNESGAPANEGLTNKIFEISKNLKEYKINDPKKIDYCNYMKEIFSFQAMKKFREENKDFKILVDGMHGVTGPYLEKIFIKELGFPSSCVMNSVPKEDFNGGHPDPNLTYAKELVDRVRKDKVDFAAAFDGDGDRNMILSHDFFVNPSDSVAFISDNINLIPYFSKQGVYGFARSMPTSAALDRVAKSKGLKVYEVPTGWKFFCNLMDSNLVSICGEESFGTGSNHVREKDGIWASLAWLSILSERKTGIKPLMSDFYKKYGRCFYSRLDYEDIESDKANKVFHHLNSLITSESMKNQQFGNFVGIRLLFKDGSRIIYRQSGTGSVGATIRIYVEKYVGDLNLFMEDAQIVLKDLIEVALNFAKIEEFTLRKGPTVIT
ncbi:phosphoglucomutase [Rozella allomycis CSF55]|uniref:phosphoglucomutase (alpha-D-glucose-1,6-bisphosphate-dependent) n=1 Tax=Rozella allomycis (strain CSF55) TaxID=988480 RepID=A0A075AZS7_ROZAC|nr:Alpha-D-phosphohexomutase, alpha/beta/alpha I domain-containing protein [Rozella allomycis CSF55]RKP20764.1 phosphoglucomutase [Rozella allomycis CSF55]|eukprot:EPZ34197.1 Alpha-D-phosphohexomutase, alpha/beta/alpha I domain-containing protein [Rozella allomycis CSF55]